MGKVTILDKDGNEKELETVPSYEEKPADAHEGSGLHSILQDYMGDKDGDEDGKTNKGAGDEDGATEDGDKDDEAKRKKAEAAQKLLDGDTDGDEEEDGKGKGKDGDGDGDDPSTSDKDKDGKLKNVSSEFDELGEAELRQKAIVGKATLLEKDNKIKELETTLKTTQSSLSALQKDGVGDSEVTEFLKGLRTDFSGTVNKYREKYGIPDNNVLLTQMGGGATQAKNARLKQFIDADLKPKIEKDFKLDKGTFKYDDTAGRADPESASYAFIKGLEAKEAELDNADSALKLKEKETFDLMVTRQATDKQWYADKYYGGDLTKVEEVVTNLNAIPAKIASGELKPEDHPLSLRYVLRGYNYEAHAKAEVDAAIEGLKVQLKELGVTFPDGMELPTDLTKLKKKEVKGDDKPFKIKQSEHSPMALSIEATLNN